MAKFCTKKVREDLSGIDFEYSDGDVDTVKLEDLSREILTQLAIHGISQKVGDSYAGVETLAEAKEKARDVMARLASGDWKTVRAAGSPKATELAEALARATGQDLAKCQEVLADMDDSTKKGLRKHPQVDAALAEIRAEKAAKRAAAAAAKAGDSEQIDLSGLMGS